MNERIEKLAEQAYKEVVETNDYNGGAYTVREFDKEKFAELIVRECTGIISDNVNQDEYWSRTTSAESILAIEEHFGVEE